MTMRKGLMIVVAVCGGFAAAAGPLLAQARPGGQAQPSLGDVARKARDAKMRVVKPARVWTDEDIPNLHGVVSEPGQPPAPPPAAQAGQEGAAPAEAGDRAEEIKKAEAELKAAKADAARVEKELDLLNREFDLDRQQFSSNPNYQSDAAGKARLDAEAKQIEAKKQELQQAEDKVTVVERRLAQLKRPPETQQPSTPQTPAPQPTSPGSGVSLR